MSVARRGALSVRRRCTQQRDCWYVNPKVQSTQRNHRETANPTNNESLTEAAWRLVQISGRTRADRLRRRRRGAAGAACCLLAAGALVRCVVPVGDDDDIRIAPHAFVVGGDQQCEMRWRLVRDIHKSDNVCACILFVLIVECKLETQRHTINMTACEL